MFCIARYPTNTTFLHFKSYYQVNRLPSGVRSIWFYFSLFVEVPQRRTQIELLDTGRYRRHVDGSIQSKLKGQTICQCSSSVANMSRNKQRNKNKTKQNKKKINNRRMNIKLTKRIFKHLGPNRIFVEMNATV